MILPLPNLVSLLKGLPRSGRPERDQLTPSGGVLSTSNRHVVVDKLVGVSYSARIRR